jgi:hypothetical protein
MTASDTRLPEKQAAPTESRPWPVKAITLLLFLQTAGLLTIAAYNFNRLDLSAATTPLAILLLVLSVLTSSIAFSALALLNVVAAVSFLGLWRTGWSNAMLVQGMTLLVALVLYFRGGGTRAPHPFYIYFLMVYGIFMVIYLHHPDVQAAFHVRPSSADVEESP